MKLMGRPGNDVYMTFAPTLPDRLSICILAWVAHVGCDEDRILIGTSLFVCFCLAW